MTVGLISDEWARRAEFRRFALARLDEVRESWAVYAESRRFRFVPHGVADLPVLDGRIENTDVRIAAVGCPDTGYRTLATAQAKVALGGTLRLRPFGGGVWDDVAALVRRRFFDDPVLARLLVVKASSRSFAKTLLDARVLQTVQALAPAGLHLSYVGAAITVEWGGIEQTPHILDDVFAVLSYLAIQGSEQSPYR